LIASSGIRAKVDCFLQQSPIRIITMSFWNEDERARLDKMRSEFLAYKEEASKRMKEIRKTIESFSPPSTAHNTYPTGCHHHKKEEEKSGWSNKNPSTPAFHQTTVDRPQISPPQP
jgi:hypothetical protein